ncbi:hypothetical protein DUNSADRAFT_18735 [Dunaliella salina]|uniref:Uncharacterized protein n=1 Tax=Dunaliella salina TaxID=3046 RepID=A0ABQ7GYP7_DUNSA|nr:hypothetical protein DUNSADRAFT_18735 [Dunaliella salina]|eukprot:KAF5839735.1 hypothetical protein DUNSADRAFT_18735 [Dunaliella salina]
MVLQAGSGAWATASHAELARPMLTVAAGSLLVALAAALRLVGEPAAAEPLLRSLVQLLVLCGVLGLDEQCKQCVDVLADLSGVFRPAPCGSLLEQRQLAALKVGWL